MQIVLYAEWERWAVKHSDMTRIDSGDDPDTNVENACKVLNLLYEIWGDKKHYSLINIFI